MLLLPIKLEPKCDKICDKKAYLLSAIQIWLQKKICQWKEHSFKQLMFYMISVVLGFKKKNIPQIYIYDEIWIFSIRSQVWFMVLKGSVVKS